MIKLDKTKIYDLSELTSEELKELWKYLVKTDSDWEDCKYEEMITYQKTDRLVFNTHNWEWCNISEPTANAKELFYTLENIQVDCSNETEERIKEMAMVFYNSGYKTGGFEQTTYLKYLVYTGFSCCIQSKSEDKTTITYEKFMELFGNKEENFKKLVEVLNEELTEKANLEFNPMSDHELFKAYEVSYIAEKPKQYQIGIDTFERCEANMTKEEILACVRFNIDKYNFRVKGQDLEDLEKIIDYANWGIKQLKK